MKSLLKEFKDFIATGNMIELAVAVILGAAVKNVIDAFTNGVMMNLIAAIFGKPDFNSVARLKVRDADLVAGTDATYLEFGTVLTQIIVLLMTGLALFMIIKAYNKMKKPADAGPAGPTEVELLTEIRDSLRRS